MSAATGDARSIHETRLRSSIQHTHRTLSSQIRILEPTLHLMSGGIVVAVNSIIISSINIKFKERGSAQ